MILSAQHRAIFSCHKTFGPDSSAIAGQASTIDRVGVELRRINRTTLFISQFFYYDDIQGCIWKGTL